MESDSVVYLDEATLHHVIVNGSLNFDEWTSLISEVDKSFYDNIEIICSVYESFLSKFPLCHGYWRKYADHKIHMCTVDKVVEVFEQAVESATYSVDLWVDYCTFGSLVFEDPSDVRRLFKRGISFVGKDYLCHTLWDKYIDFEFSEKHWDSLANVYIQTLRFPTKKLPHYYDSFKKFVRIWEEEMKAHSNSTLEASVEPQHDSHVPCYKQEDISCTIRDLLDPSAGLARFKALQKYKCIGERFYKEAFDLNEKIDCFESRIKRSYFHVKPLDVNQLENWHHFLDFAELHGDFDWVVKLYERCLIPCANYPEFWMRYVEFLESKGGREIANFALERATQIFLQRVSAIHQFNARFKEHTGDVINARAAFLQCDTESDSAFVENVVMRANMEKRLGNFIEASNVYKEALEMAERKDKCHILPSLYVHFSRLKYMTTDNEDAVRDILLDGIKHMPSCKLLIKELITFAMTHRWSGHINMVDSIVGNAISPAPGVSQGLSSEDGEDISRLYLEFVDLCGTVNDVRNAWNRHVKLFSYSMRTTIYHSATGTKQWQVNTEPQQETFIALPRQPSGDCSSDNLIQSSLQDEKLSLLENQDTQAAHPASDHVVQNENSLSDQARVDLHKPGESDNNVQESLQGSLKVAEPCGEGASEPIVSLDLVHQVGNVIAGAQASLECSTENDVQQGPEYEPEQNLMPPSLERLSLVTPQTHDSKAPQEISSFLPTSPQRETPHEKCVSDRSTLKSEDPRENSLSNGSMPSVDNFLSSPMSTQAAFLDPVNTGHASLFSAGYQNIKTQELSQPHMSANSGRNWHQRSHSDRHRRDSKFGFRGHSHRRLHQKQQASPQRQYARTETGSMPKSQGYSSQPLPSQSPQIQQGSQVQGQFPASTAHANLTAPQAWPVHNEQQQNLNSACQSQPPVQPGTYPQAQMSQYPMQSNEQHGNVQNNQAYNQMLQYYYYQQQQQFLWQQQQQPQPQQQLLMQQYQQQQFLQMQYLQQQQLQQQQLPYQQQQLQQLQQELQPQLPQQLVQQQQQPYQLQQQPSQQQQVQQQHLVYLQKQQQMQLQQQQNNQLQMQLQQQQQYQQEPVPQQQQHDEQGQPGAVQVHDAAHNKDTSGIVEFSASSNPQQQSPQTQ